jgi:hypothetical protein
MLPEDGYLTETCKSRFNVDFNVNFNFNVINILCIRWWKKKNFDNIKMRDTTVKITKYIFWKQTLFESFGIGSIRLGC